MLRAYDGKLAGTYKYKYLGQEWQDELGLNVYDFDNRVYDPAIGRFWEMDPLAENGRRWSPYNYCFDNPIYFQDPEGMWPWPTWNEVKSGVKEIGRSLKSEAREFKNAAKNAQRAVGSALAKSDNALLSRAGIAIWVDSNDLKQEGIVKPDVSKDRSSVKNIDGSTVDAIKASAGTNTDRRGKSLKERADGVADVGDKADAVSKETKKSEPNSSSMSQSNAPDETKTNTLTIIEFKVYKDGFTQTGSSITKEKVTEQQSKIDSAKAKTSTNYVKINRPDEQKR